MLSVGETIFMGFNRRDPSITKICNKHQRYQTNIKDIKQTSKIPKEISIFKEPFVLLFF
jgi:hypothetical protein